MNKKNALQQQLYLLPNRNQHIVGGARNAEALTIVLIRRGAAEKRPLKIKNGIRI